MRHLSPDALARLDVADAALDAIPAYIPPYGIGPFQQARADALAARLVADLDRVPTLTDFSCTLREAARLRLRVEWFRKHGNTGMLGENGIAPSVAMCVRLARAHGFLIAETLDPYEAGPSAILGRVAL